ncbi:galectin-3-binding protein A [Pygocentrus nattereri]|uniref:SRCR domain-containing protein n=1 Tax=Pygocentrus nattereri TaxID=42514 RepID=A0A3B4C7I1_PYGNA|nr:galectin-3-binding protein A [Pygocentrus nattereri]XP_017567474.1 galectin-3-binding protein A [Pygocentrus nattereri]
MIASRFSFCAVWPLLLLHVSAQGWSLFDIQRKGPPQEGGLRLVGSDLPYAGRVELYHDGQWGTVCDDNWEIAQALVVCRQLGFPGAVSATAGGANGEGSGPIWLDDVSCTGSESSLSTCHFKGWGVTDCSHKEDAGVVCESGQSVDSGRTFSLDHSLGLSEKLGSLFDSGDNCDFSILISDPSDEQVATQTICAHRAILSLYPQLNITSTNLSVEIGQTCHPFISRFIRYLYTRKIDITLSSAQCLHQLSYMFELKQLKEEVGRVFTMLLPQDKTFHTQVSLYEYGVRTMDLLLQENVLQYLSWNFEFLIISPVWKTISEDIMEALLSRSDLVVKDEAFVFEALQAWLKERKDTISLEKKADLLKQIRFPMIPVEKLYDFQFSSDIYHSNEAFYSSAFLKAFQFNTLPFSKIWEHFNNTEGYLPRIYTADPWGVVLNYTSTGYDYRFQYHSYGSYSERMRSFTTPVHNSVIFKEQRVNWQAQIFLYSGECSNQGLTCNSLPLARLYNYDGRYTSSSIVRFSNRLILTCKTENTVFHVQDFKTGMAAIPTNSSMSLPCPCPDNYSFTFVVRPEYI